MITRAEIEKLAAVHVVEPMVLSVYLDVPSRPADWPGLPDRVDELIARAVSSAGQAGHVRKEDRKSARENAAKAGLDWPGRTVAIFACAEADLLEAFPLPCHRPERARLGIRPHVRPLLAARQESRPRARSLADEILAAPPGEFAVIGLPGCLAAVNACAVDTLVVPDAEVVPGYECGRCGALGVAADCCPDWGTAALPVSDVIEEMVSRTLEDGGEILVMPDAPARMAARLYFPVAQ